MTTLDNSIFWQDEILQILFWMRGEGLGEMVAIEEINRFIVVEEQVLRVTLQRLVEMGYLQLSTVSDDLGKVCLTEQGIKEGKKRFKDEFENYLGHEDHMVCDDPNCDCHAENIEGTCNHFSLDQGHHH
jgi:hypothetical protein